MSELADLFPTFGSQSIDTSGGRIFVRTGGHGSPVLLLHGYPQSHVMWHRLAPELAQHHQLVLADLPGYGASDAPPADPDHVPYTKRAMAKAMVEIMRALGHARFAVVGHDRGGRVGYRMALDHGDRVTRLVLLDIIPTYEMWVAMDRHRAMQVYHWMFLAQGYPMPEMLIGKAPIEYLEWTMGSWQRGRDLSVFDVRALAHYRASFSDPKRIHASCEDYRAGQSTDFAHDEADVQSGRKIACPTLALWGSRGIPGRGENPLAVWRRWGTNVAGQAIDCGHFLPEENPQATMAALLPFLAAG